MNDDQDEDLGDRGYAEARHGDDNGSRRVLTPTERGPEGFHSSLVEARTQDAGAIAGVARERFEIEAMVAIAQQTGRDQMRAWQMIATTCQRPTFAEKAEYRYKRGDSTISGVSIRGLRPIAQAWGNIRFGWTFVRSDEEGFHIRGYAHDLITNAFRTQEDSGKWAYQRKGRDGQPTRWIKVTDERERREIVGRRGSILERNCLAGIIPFDIIEDAMKACRATNRKAAAKDLKENPVETRRALVAAFIEVDVTAQEIEARLGHPLDKMNAEELEELRSIWRAIRDNGEPREKYFGDDAEDGGDKKPAAGDAQTTGAKLDLSNARSAKPQDAPGGHAVGGAASETKLADAQPQKTSTGPGAGTSKPAAGQGTLDVDAKTKKDPPPPTAKS